MTRAGRFFKATMSDTYPNIFRIDDAPGVSVWHRKRLRRVANVITRRTGLFCSYNSHNKSLLFHLNAEPIGGPLRLPAFHPDGAEVVYSDGAIDDAVRFICLGRMSRSEKDRIAAKDKQIETWEHQDRIEKRLDERRPDAISYATYLDQKRRGVQKVSVAL